jgi:hypothetical protein
MINKPRFRKGKKINRKWKAGKPLTGKERKTLLRYQFAILRFTMDRMIAGTMSMAVAKSALIAATGAMQIGVMNSQPIPRDEALREQAKKLKTLRIAQSVINTATAVNKSFQEAAEATRKATEVYQLAAIALHKQKFGIGHYEPPTA